MLQKPLFLFFQGETDLVTEESKSFLDIIVDGERIWCDDKTLQFLDFPKTISIGGKTILSIAVPQHFSMKIARIINDFEIVSKFQPLNRTDPHIVEEIVSYFQVAETIHWSLFTMGLVLSLFVLIMICFCSYLKCPSFMSKILQCCCKQTCCILQCLYNRVRDNEILRA